MTFQRASISNLPDEVSVSQKGRLLVQGKRQQARRRQQSVLMRSTQAFR